MNKISLVFVFLVLMGGFVLAQDFQKGQSSNIPTEKELDRTSASSSSYDRVVIIAIFVLTLAFVIILALALIFSLKNNRIMMLVILGLACLVGIISIISALFITISQLIGYGEIVDGDAIGFNVWIAIPVIFGFWLFFKLVKNKKAYEDYKLTINFAGWGIIVTILFAILILDLMTIYAGRDIGMGLIIPIIILIGGAVLSLVLSIIGLIIDKAIRKR